ncbi:MAG: SoxR reducing system RseC family protein [Clostridia bacterium]|nr:SoxR reducing system RseC family protein [Clostridia bacterium]
MKVTGTVLKRLNEKNILIKVIRSSACGGNCHTCGMCQGGEADIIAECSEPVQEGDKVLVTIPNKRFFSISFAVFFLPLAVMIVAFWFCNRYYAEAVSALMAFLAGVLFFVGITVWFRRLQIPKATKKED